MTAIELVTFTKNNGPLTKRIWLAADGTVKSDGTACVMGRGTAKRVRVADVGELANVIDNVRTDQAIALGALRSGLPDRVQVVTKQMLNGQHDVIARTGSDIIFRNGQPALGLLDFDLKGMPPEIAAEMQRLGGFWPSLLSVLPPLRAVAHVSRCSTSAGLFRSDTGEQLPGSGGLHVYLSVRDGSDIERFLRALHERCWLAGFGWLMVGAGGQLLERSIVDRMVGAPERLVFEGAPILVPPLDQDLKTRQPIPVDGANLDTRVTCPDLDIVERSHLKELKAKAAGPLQGEATKVRREFEERRAEVLAKRTGLSLSDARQQIVRQCEGTLLPDVVLPFDDEDFAGCTVGDVLSDPARFEGATLADPIEGIEYGACVARIMRRTDGTLWIHSFAHGRTVYELKHNAASVRVAIDKADAKDAVKIFIAMIPITDFDFGDHGRLRKYVAERAGMGLREIDHLLKAAELERRAKRKREAEERRRRERSDPRPQILRPEKDAEWLPIMDVLNRVIGKSTALHPPARNIEGYLVKSRKCALPGLHAFSSANEDAKTDLPPPEQWTIRQLSEAACAEMIEQYIDFIDRFGRSVRLQAGFVQHYQVREDDALPLLVAVATAPLVMADGDVIGRESGFDPKRGLDFHIQLEIAACVPDPSTITEDDVVQAMQFLIYDWLADVLANYAGRCVAIASALTILERSLLNERPGFIVNAGRRGTGKGTLLKMLIKAVTGVEPAAAAWSNNEEERRKALLAYFLAGVPYIN
jgi:hypothetical protein